MLIVGWLCSETSASYRMSPTALAVEAGLQEAWTVGGPCAGGALVDGELKMSVKLHASPAKARIDSRARRGNREAEIFMVFITLSIVRDACVYRDNYSPIRP